MVSNKKSTVKSRDLAQSDTQDTQKKTGSKSMVVAKTEDQDQDRESAQSDGVVGELANKAKDVAGQVWLAGLGAYAKVEQEGGKWFDTLVKDGERLEERTRDLLDRQLSFYKDKVGGVREKVEEVKDMATHSIDRLEKVFDERVSRALARLNIPSHKEIQALKKELDRLRAELEKLQKDQKKRVKHSGSDTPVTNDKKSVAGAEPVKTLKSEKPSVKKQRTSEARKVEPEPVV